MENKEKTLRDELAMSLDASFIPTFNSETAIKHIAGAYGLEYDMNDPVKMIDFALKFQAIVRYEYADAMLAVRG
jgi:hypothetical protein